MRVGTRVTVPRGKHKRSGRIVKWEDAGSGIFEYSVEFADGTVESFPSYVVALSPKDASQSSRKKRPWLRIGVASAALVTAAATVGIWLWPHSPPKTPPVPPKTSVRGLWVKDLDAKNEWVHDLVIGPTDRLWVSG